MENNLSKGAQKIYNLLKQEHKQFVTEYSFADLGAKRNTPFRFDFAVFNNNKLDYLIEYDGEAHFERINFFHKTKTDYDKARGRDRKKNRYCLLHNIKLYRIPFWEIDNIHTLNDILMTPKFLVKTIEHNDQLVYELLKERSKKST